MIAYVRGILGEKSPTTAVVEAAGVGYEMLIPLSTYERLPREGGEVKLLAFHGRRPEDGARDTLRRVGLGACVVHRFGGRETHLGHKGRRQEDGREDMRGASRQGWSPCVWVGRSSVASAQRSRGGRRHCIACARLRGRGERKDGIRRVGQESRRGRRREGHKACVGIALKNFRRN